MRFNDTITLDEDDGKIKIIWLKDESFPLNKTSRQTEIIVIVGEHVEKIMMKFNFKHRSGPEPYKHHGVPNLNWWIILNILNRTIGESLNN